MVDLERVELSSAPCKGEPLPAAQARLVDLSGFKPRVFRALRLRRVVKHAIRPISGPSRFRPDRLLHAMQALS